ncbi:MAG TPA: response regulator transcription factor [Solimonas sp.]
MSAETRLVADVLIVDDLAATRSWLQRACALAFADARIVCADSLRSGREAARAQLPDLALIDLRLPDGHGSALISELRAARASACLIVPTIFDDDAYLFDALRAGASGYLLKDQSPETLASGLQRLQRGEPAMSMPLARRVLRMAQNDTLSLRAEERLLLQARARGLSPTEAATAANLDRARAGRCIAAIYRRLAGGED